MSDWIRKWQNLKITDDNDFALDKDYIILPLYQSSFSSFFTRSYSNDLLRKTDLSCLTPNLHTVWLIQPSRRNILPKSFHKICRVNQMDIRLNRMTIIQQQSSFSGTGEGTFYHTSGWKSLKAIHWIEFSLSYLKRRINLRINHLQNSDPGIQAQGLLHFLQEKANLCHTPNLSCWTIIPR